MQRLTKARKPDEAGKIEKCIMILELAESKWKQTKMAANKSSRLEYKGHNWIYVEYAGTDIKKE